MDILIRLLIVLFLLLFGANESAVPPSSEPEETVHALTQIDSVEAMILKSFPAQINLVVAGYQPDGCDYPVQISQTREGNTVHVEIYREVPLNIMCPAVLLSYNESIHLDGSFEPGTYTIVVNNFTLEVTV